MFVSGKPGGPLWSQLLSIPPTTPNDESLFGWAVDTWVPVQQLDRNIKARIASAYSDIIFFLRDYYR